MRHHASTSLPAPQPPRSGDWRVIGTLLPYLWAYKGRVIVALTALVAAKVANVGVPVLLKSIVDSLDARTAALALPSRSCSPPMVSCACLPRCSPNCAISCSPR